MFYCARFEETFQNGTFSKIKNITDVFKDCECNPGGILKIKKNETVLFVERILSHSLKEKNEKLKLKI